MREAKKMFPSSRSAIAGPKTTWSATFLDEGPAFRHLPAVPSQPAAALREGSPAERRSSPRRPMQLGVEIYGYDGDLSLIHAYGTTDNVSAGGLYAFVDTGLPVGSRAVVAVRRSHPALEPSVLRGRVVRCAERTNGYGLAIHFDLDVEGFRGETG